MAGSNSEANFGLHGKRVLITGGTAGIGLAVAKRFVAAGASVAISGRRAEGAAIAADIDAMFLAADVAIESEVVSMFEGAVEALGGLDVLVINAGIDPGMAPITTYSNEAFNRNLDVNLRHVWWSLVQAGALLSDGGSIITTSSTLAIYKVPNVSAYAAIKEAVVSLTKSAALELAPRGIRANAVMPGTTYSDMTPPDHWEIPVMETMLPLGRAADADRDLVGLYQFLASDESSYITGQAIAADGGMTLGMSYGTLRTLGAPADVMSPGPHPDT
ncbi:MAG: SDR family oxidoreductase [Acidimicrobiales bacterium]|nr:SDR family oxidoreductase [Acidimicrobiia bacterium]NNC80454.1 SDR family oxidoreductase [Acidimicrobiales bacterium]RZV46379.1 MAG: SDR family oxidoreductase [Acidimicrobiales bacterium]